MNGTPKHPEAVTPLRPLGESSARRTFGVVVLNGRGKIVVSDPVAEELLGEGGPVAREALSRHAPAEELLSCPKGWLLLQRQAASQSGDRAVQVIAVERGDPVWLRVTLSAKGVTPRELEVAMRASRGARPAEIAAALGTSIHTVRAQLKRVYAKTGCAGQVALVAWVRGGLELER